MAALTKVKDWYQQESVLVGGVVTAATGLYSAFVAHLTGEQTAAVSVFVAAVTALLARSQVTPVAKG